jgi:hypothetical protein
LEQQGAPDLKVNVTPEGVAVWPIRGETHR